MTCMKLGNLNVIYLPLKFNCKLRQMFLRPTPKSNLQPALLVTRETLRRSTKSYQDCRRQREGYEYVHAGYMYAGFVIHILEIRLDVYFNKYIQEVDKKVSILENMVVLV